MKSKLETSVAQRTAEESCAYLRGISQWTTFGPGEAKAVRDARTLSYVEQRGCT